MFACFSQNRRVNLSQAATLRVMMLLAIALWVWLALHAIAASIVNEQSLPETNDSQVIDAWFRSTLVGEVIPLDLVELGAEGPATVTAIESCPPIENTRTDGRQMITGTFRHSAGNVIRLDIAGEPDSIGVTDNHPFWSEDRQTFVPAGDLRPQENLRRADGTLTQLTRITPHRGPPVEVFNLEIDGERVYYIGYQGVLVHNNYAQIASDAAGGFRRFECHQCADSILAALKQNGVPAHKVTLKFGEAFRGRVVSVRLGDELISETGDHSGVFVRGTVYDNLTPDGIPFREWINDFDAMGGLTEIKRVFQSAGP